MSFVVTSTGGLATLVTEQSALDTIKRALRLIRVLGESEEPSDQEARDCLVAWNGLLDAWGIERLMLYELIEESFTWPANTTSRTIGAGGDFDTARPVRIQSAFTRDSSGSAPLDTPLKIIEREDYDLMIELKSQAGSIYPDFLFYDPSYPLGTLYLVYRPASQTALHLSSWKAFTQFNSFATKIAYPPGYKRMFDYNLAVEVAPEFGKTPSPDVIRIAAETKRHVKSLNVPSMVAQLDAALVPASVRSNIFQG